MLLHRIGDHPQPGMRDLTPTRDVAPSRGWFQDQFSSTKAESGYYNMHHEPPQNSLIHLQSFQWRGASLKIEDIWRPCA